MFGAHNLLPCLAFLPFPFASASLQNRSHAAAGHRQSPNPSAHRASPATAPSPNPSARRATLARLRVCARASSPCPTLFSPPPCPSADVPPPPPTSASTICQAPSASRHSCHHLFTLDLALAQHLPWVCHPCVHHLLETMPKCLSLNFLLALQYLIAILVHTVLLLGVWCPKS
jgi:hypothetical protein